MHNDIERILITPEQLGKKIAELGRQITHDYRGKNLTLVTVLKGSVVFLADLSRRLELPHRYEFVVASSYGASHVSSGQVTIGHELGADISDRHVLLIEDIYDTGRTLNAICDRLHGRSPLSLEVCTLLEKEKVHDFEITIKYVGFHIPDIFVVGYGLDYNELYRSLPYVGILKKEIFSQRAGE